MAWMRPPGTRVWLLKRTTAVSASRLTKRDEMIGGSVRPDVVDLLLDVERDRALLADARRHGQDDAGVPVPHGLGDGIGRAAALYL